MRITNILAKGVLFGGDHDFSKLDHLKSEIQKSFVSICFNLVLKRLIFKNFEQNGAVNKKNTSFMT